MKTQNRSHRRRRGYALVLVLIIAGLFVGLASAIGTQVSINLNATRKRMDSSSARYAAYAGLQHAVMMLKIDPDWDDGLIGVQLFNTKTEGYTVEVTNNRSGTSAVNAPDGTSVPAGAVYCASVGVVNEQQAMLLHAMTGMLAERSPEVDHAAFADTDLAFSNNSESLSYDPANTSFSFDAQGRAIPSTTEENGDVGSNRYVSVADASAVAGDVYSPVGTPASILSSSAPTGSLLDLLDPVKVPDYSAPVQATTLTTLSSNPASLASATPTRPVAYQSLVLTPGNSVTVEPGKYYFPDGISIDGEIQPSTSVSPADPIIFFVGNDALFGDNALVNAGGDTQNFQVYFVDHSDGSSQEMNMTGDSQVFGTVVGSTVTGNFYDDSELFGGFLGRAVNAFDSAKIVYDESLENTPLGVDSNWGLAGITEPPPAEILSNYTASKTFISTVEAGSHTYSAPLDGGAGAPTSVMLAAP